MPPDPTLTAEALILVQAQAASREQIATASTGAAVAAVRAFIAANGVDGWRDAAGVTRLAKQLAVITRAGQRQTTVSTAAYWARIASLLTGRRVAPVRPVDPALTAVVRGVPLEDVFGRLADQHRWLQASRGPATSDADRLKFAVESHTRRLARQASTLDRPDLGAIAAHVEVIGSDLLEAIRRERDAGTLDAAELGRRLDELIAASPTPTLAPDPLADADIDQRVLDRVELLVDSTLTATLREQIRAAAKADPRRVVGYRRVLHPELSKGGSCGLCIVAATRVYKREAMLPFHDRCACEVIMIVDEVGGPLDVGDAINQMDLERFYLAAGDTTNGRALKETRWRIVETDELGQRLVPEGQSLYLEPSRTYGGPQRGKADPKTPRLAVKRGSVDPAAVLAAAERSIADLERRKAVGETGVDAPLAFQRALAARMADQLRAAA